ncbi:MAG: V-type ATP synthase subunit I [Lachnospiraceae bacterium]|nr:V-type ATP synthase subunit I [Lachnospiraceae bacterium]
MAVVKMKKLTVCALKENRKGVLEFLQKLGVVDVKPGIEAEGTFRMETQTAEQRYERHGNIARDAVEILNGIQPEKKSFFESLNGKAEVREEELKRISDSHVAVLNIGRAILRLQKEIEDNEADITKYRGRIEILEPWSAYDIPMNLRRTRTVRILTGTLPKEMTSADVKQLLSEKLPECENYEVDVISSGFGVTNLAVTALREEADELEAALREEGMAEATWNQSVSVKEEISGLEDAIKKCEGVIKQDRELLEAYLPERKDLEMLYDYYQIRERKYHYLGGLAQTENVFFIEGYVPEKYAARVADVLEKEFDAFTEVEEPAEIDDVPVLLKNNSFSESAEGVLESYGLPHKGELDPTFWMSIFYVILFGIMLSDAAYGAIVSIGCAVVLWKCPNMGKSMRRMLKLFFWCGLSTIFWGVMFGGYFGDAITVVAKTFFHKDVVIKPLWFAPLDDPMRMLIASLVFGIIHLLFGLGLKGYSMLKDGDVTGFIFDVLCWFMLIIGLIMMLVPTELFAGLAGKLIVFPAWANVLAKVLAIGGALGIFLMSGRRKKNIALRLGLGAYDLYGITSWLSDILSYSRLLALGLATGVMASVFNQMGSMFGGGIIGGILFLVVFLIGHVFNLGINMLGAYVHTSRLQYVEFFGKFYEGGGTPFVPFDRETKFVEFKEEKQQ